MKRTFAAAIFALLAVAAPVFADEYFSDEQKQIIASGFDDFRKEMHDSGFLGVQATIQDCYQSAISKGLREKLLYCIAFDTQTTVYYRLAVGEGFRPRFLYFEDDTYEARIRKNLADVGMPNAYEQTDFIAEMKDELNRVAGQFVRRKTGKDKADDQLDYINRMDATESR